MIDDGFETVIGLEVHVELKTKTKIFCSCCADFGAEPNTRICPVCVGAPGVLPVLNKKAVELAAVAGIVTGCRINEFSAFARKNYFYPDLPKGYQITQDKYPICEDGSIEISGRKIGIQRIHMEEDAGKLIHAGEYTYVDYNRCGIPLIEIVTRPELHSGEETAEFLKTLKGRLEYAGVSDCRMNEGSMRCDLNISVHRVDEPYGERTEIKNLGSIRDAAAAVEYESKRQIDLILAGGKVRRDTLRFDSASGKTVFMRSKEDTSDYRYFPEPDLPPVFIEKSYIDKLRSSIPRMPDERRKDYMSTYGMTEYQAEQLTDKKNVSDLFESAAMLTVYRDKLVSLMLTVIFRLAESDDLKISPENLAGTAELLGQGKLNNGSARKLLEVLWKDGGEAVRTAEKLGLLLVQDSSVLEKYAADVVRENPKAVSDYFSGKAVAYKALMGRMMAKTKGTADPMLADRALKAALEVK